MGRYDCLSHSKRNRCHFRDINERAKIKEALQESNIALEKAIAMKDEFLTLMSHELRTPLTVIISAIQLLKTLSWDELPDKAKGYFDTIRKNSNRQLKLVNNILDITRINAGRYDVSLSNTDIVSLTNSIIESIKPYAERKKINIKFSFAPAKMIIGTDQENMKGYFESSFQRNKIYE
jgi:two-component system sensor histidine kinase/response regulator